MHRVFNSKVSCWQFEWYTHGRVTSVGLSPIMLWDDRFCTVPPGVCDQEHSAALHSSQVMWIHNPALTMEWYAMIWVSHAVGCYYNIYAEASTINWTQQNWCAGTLTLLDNDLLSLHTIYCDFTKSIIPATKLLDKAQNRCLTKLTPMFPTWQSCGRPASAMKLNVA